MNRLKTHRLSNAPVMSLCVYPFLTGGRGYETEADDGCCL